jgi:hypothetical protein
MRAPFANHPGLGDLARCLALEHRGIGCGTRQPILAGDDPRNRTQEAEWKRVDVEARRRSPVGMGFKTSQRLTVVRRSAYSVVEL